MLLKPEFVCIYVDLLGYLFTVYMSLPIYIMFRVWSMFLEICLYTYPAIFLSRKSHLLVTSAAYNSNALQTYYITEANTLNANGAV